MFIVVCLLWGVYNTFALERDGSAFRGGQSSGRDLDFGGIRERERISHVMRKSPAGCVMCDVRRVWMSKQFESTNGISNVMLRRRVCGSCWIYRPLRHARMQGISVDV